MPPAACRVVPRAEKTTSGVGLLDERLDAHLVVSGSMVAVNLGDWVLGARREMV